jgi:DNA-binding PadR family transcriptional regulator
MSYPTPDETLLGLLMQQPQHGYQLLETFQDVSALGRVWKLSTSQLYAVLKRLQAQGFIIGEEAYSADAPPRMVYHITESGKALVMAWLAEEHPSPSVRRVRVEFLSRLYVARILNLSSANILHSQKTTCEHKYQQLIAQHQLTENTIGDLALEFEIAQLEAILGWITQMELMSV